MSWQILQIAVIAMHAASLTPGDHARSLEVDSRTRTYQVHVPASYNAARPIPVVLAFHGGGTDAESMIHFSGLNEKSDKAGFLAVYPNGTGRRDGIYTFNAGNCCGYAERNGIDDVRFVAALLDDLAGAANVDVRRVYATGMSNGAMMCYRLASEMSDRIAAIAAVAGPIGTETCQPKLPVSVIHFHGTDDNFAPFAGGVGKRSLTRTNFFSVDHSLQAWIKANGCPATPDTTTVKGQADDGMQITRTTYGPGKDGAEVILYTIRGGGHTWPGRVPRLAFLGKSTTQISANDLMWEFFQKHSRP